MAMENDVQASWKSIGAKRWLNGHVIRNGTVSVYPGIRCCCCGRVLGSATYAIVPGCDPFQPVLPRFPFNEDECPLCDVKGILYDETLPEQRLASFSLSELRKEIQRRKGQGS